MNNLTLARKKKLLTNFAYSLSGTALLGTIVFLLTGYIYTLVFVGIGVAVLGGVAALYAAHKNKLERSAQIITALFYIGITLTTWRAGIYGVGLIGYVLVILCAATLFTDRRQLLFVISLCYVTIFIFFIRSYLGLSGLPSFRTPVVSLFIVLLVLTLCSLLLNYTVRQYTDTLNELNQKSLELAQARDAAQVANRAKDDFLANTSHELRTPLNAINGYSRLLMLSKILPDQQTQYVEAIMQNSQHLTALIEDVLAHAQSEALTLKLSPTSVHLPQFIQSVHASIAVQAREKGLSLTFNVSNEIPVGVVVDEKRLRQILINLLSNAIKFTQHGSVILNVETEPVRENIQRVSFSISDTGKGMTPSQIDQAFIPFEQVTESNDSADVLQTGAGLGLSISKTLVTLMGGDLEVKSTVGKGSKFSFSLLLPVATNYSPASEDEHKTRIVGYDGMRRTILVADDNQSNREILTTDLTRLGFHVIEATNGQEAIELTTSRKPDIVLMDLVMPELDGFQATREIHQSMGENAPRIVAISASVFEKNKSSSLLAGCDAFLGKPIQFPQLYELFHEKFGVEWIYESTEYTEHSVKDLQAEAPPREILSHLNQLATLGKIQELGHQVEHINELGYTAFALKLKKLAEEYRLNEIKVLIQNAGEGNG